ncbi:hypothetical protein ACHQM5_005387 [Ranunculus cassubicifolius]
MASTWTPEQIRKFQAAFTYAYKSESIEFDSSEFWEYIVKEVDGKTARECMYKYEEYLQDCKDGKLDEFPPVKNEKSEDKKNENSEDVKNEKSEDDVKNDNSEDKK